MCIVCLSTLCFLLLCFFSFGFIFVFSSCIIQQLFSSSLLLSPALLALHAPSLSSVSPSVSIVCLLSLFSLCNFLVFSIVFFFFRHNFDHHHHYHCHRLLFSLFFSSCLFYYHSSSSSSSSACSWHHFLPFFASLDFGSLAFVSSSCLAESMNIHGARILRPLVHIHADLVPPCQPNKKTRYTEGQT